MKWGLFMKKLLLCTILLLGIPLLQAAQVQDHHDEEEVKAAASNQESSALFERFDDLSNSEYSKHKSKGPRPFSPAELTMLKKSREKYTSEFYKDGESYENYNEIKEDSASYDAHSLFMITAGIGGAATGIYALYTLATTITNYWRTRTSNKQTVKPIATKTNRTKQKSKKATTTHLNKTSLRPATTRPCPLNATKPLPLASNPPGSTHKPHRDFSI